MGEHPPGSMLEAFEELHASARELRNALGAEILAHPWWFVAWVLSYFPILWIVEWLRPGG